MASVFDCTAMGGTSDKTVLKKNFYKVESALRCLSSPTE